MPAMTAAVVAAAGSEHAGVASGILNAARQCGGALGVALFGALLGSTASGSGSPGAARALNLHLPLAVGAALYLAALLLARLTIRARR
jgi:DHA2 family methylenomycin A resistance protein-like MFS transporter